MESISVLAHPPEFICHNPRCKQCYHRRDARLKNFVIRRYAHFCYPGKDFDAIKTQDLHLASLLEKRN